LWGRPFDHDVVLKRFPGPPTPPVEKDGLTQTEARLIWVRIGNCRKSVLLEAFKNALKTIEQKLEAGETLIELY
jgi:hypothetical protein